MSDVSTSATVGKDSDGMDDRLTRRLQLANGEPTPKHHRTGNLDGMGYNRAELDHAGMRRDRLYYIFNSVVYMRPPVSGGLFRGQQYVDCNDG